MGSAASKESEAISEYDKARKGKSEVTLIKNSDVIKVSPNKVPFSPKEVNQIEKSMSDKVKKDEEVSYVETKKESSHGKNEWIGNMWSPGIFKV